ncbi:MAG: ABC transporter substrate-binding protein [Hyphomicrobiales bacterium]
MLRIFMSVLALVTFGFGTAQADEIKVGMIMSFTGPLESLVPPMVDGAELAFNEANASGELLDGSTITLVKGDATCIDSAAAVTAAEAAVAEGVVAIFGADCSGVTKAVTQNVGMPNGIPNISPAATSPSLTTEPDNGLFYRTAPSDARGGEVLAAITADKGVKSIAITYVNTDYGVGLADVFEAAVESMGIEVTAKIAHEGDKADYSAEVGVLSAAGGDALAVLGYIDQGGNQIIRGSLDSGSFDKFALGDGMIGTSLEEAFGDELNGSWGSTPGSLGESFQKFQAYASDNGVDPNSVYAGESYDAAALLILAMQAGDCDISGCNGSTDGRSIADNIQKIANGSGPKIYAGELAKGLRLLRAGNSINYQGATDVNFTEVGEAFGQFLEKGYVDGKFVNVGAR